MGEGWDGGEERMRSKLTNVARSFRKKPTEAEKLLWRHLRAKRLGGLRFRRQQPIGNYIVDFVCFEKRLIIEVDGGQHATQKEKDIERDKWFSEQGFRVLRFWNNEVLRDISIVMELIRRSA
jgi:very-short-patch-repair endonuclease